MKAPRREFSPYANRGFPTQVYFGDTHLHTSLSVDAGTFGNRLGLGEAHPFLSPDDEFANYETWDLGNLDASEAKTNEMLPGEYIRSGLMRGLEFEEKLGVNPYKVGQVGSTDAHTSLPAVEEENFFGKHSGVDEHDWRSRTHRGVEGSRGGGAHDHARAGLHLANLVHPLDPEARERMPMGRRVQPAYSFQFLQLR